jgi:hypothetical protein
MEGIPVDILDQHRTRIVQNFYQAQEDRRIATGNVQPHGARGTGSNPPRKKIRIETKEEIQARLKEYIARKRAEKEAGASGVKQEGQPEQQQQQGQQQEFVSRSVLDLGGVTTVIVDTDASQNPAYPQQAYVDPQQQQQAYAQHYAQGAAGGAYPPAQQQGYPPSSQMPSSLPARPPIPPPGLPQRPGGTGWPAGGPAPGDDIDQLIRMAEAGIKPPQAALGATAQGAYAAAAAAAAPAAAAAADSAADGKKAKRERARMIYSDPDEVSPEERMARLARYAFVEVGA